MKRIFPALLALLLILALAVPPALAAPSGAANRFNVLFVMDASGSMKQTDPEGYRFNAVRQFTDLLTEHGNVLGAVVFSTGIDKEKSPLHVDSREDKEQIIDMMKSVPSTGGWTNIGMGLTEALDQLRDYGDPDLPSVIILLSDGNTDMANSKAQQESLDLKAQAIQDARDRGVPIYAVCLNADGKADFSEMEQISKGTGGVATQVSDAEDLNDVFNNFYNLIYGTNTISIIDDTFPADGVLEANFDVPGIGVEEVNIIIQGKAAEITLTRPDGSVASEGQAEGDTSTTIKITDVQPGTWTLRTVGVPGDRIKINMVYNTNLDVSIELEAPAGSFDDQSQTYDCDQPVAVAAILSGGGQIATTDEQYTGYTAELILTDAYQENPRSVPMTVSGGRFVAENLTFGDGDVTHCQVRVTGSHLERESQILGPFRFAKRAASTGSTTGSTTPPPPPPPANTPPTPVEETVEISVNIWPFKDNSTSVDLTGLATDAEDEELRYTVESTAFMDEDYDLDDGILTIKKYSLSKGDFLIRATDSGGLYCNITVNVKSRNIGLMALIGIGAIALVVLIILGVVAYIAATKPFRGAITVRSECDGIVKTSVPRNPRRGKCKLSLFAVDSIGLDPRKSVFKATGDRYVILNTDKKVSWNGSETNRVRVESGVETCIFLTATPSRRLYLKFESRMKARARSGPRPGGQPPRSGGGKHAQGRSPYGAQRRPARPTQTGTPLNGPSTPSYGTRGQNLYGGQNPYGNQGQNPYGGQGKNPYGDQGQNPYGGQGQNPYGGK